VNLLLPHHPGLRRLQHLRDVVAQVAVETAKFESSYHNLCSSVETTKQGQPEVNLHRPTVILWRISSSQGPPQGETEPFALGGSVNDADEL
jgi:hypothetical protein